MGFQAEKSPKTGQSSWLRATCSLWGKREGHKEEMILSSRINAAEQRLRIRAVEYGDGDGDGG